MNGSWLGWSKGRGTPGSPSRGIRTLNFGPKPTLKKPQLAGSMSSSGSSFSSDA
jgi:hypothetical protein